MQEELILSLVAVQVGPVESINDLRQKLSEMGLQGAGTDALDYLRRDHQGVFAAPESYLLGWRGEEARMQISLNGQISTVVCRDVTGWRLPEDTKYVAWRFRPAAEQQ